MITGRIYKNKPVEESVEYPQQTVTVGKGTTEYIQAYERRVQRKIAGEERRHALEIQALEGQLRDKDRIISQRRHKDMQ